MKDITVFLKENISTPQAMPTMGDFQNAEISASPQDVMTAKTGTDMPSDGKKKKKKSLNKQYENYIEGSKKPIDVTKTPYDKNHPLWDVLDA